MTKVRKKSAKARAGLASYLQDLRKTGKLPAQHSHSLAVAARLYKLQEKWTRLRQEQKIRSQRLQALILGVGRKFSGAIFIPSPIDARQIDSDRLSDIAEAMRLGHAAVYWTDGAYRQHGTVPGFLGAGVVWHDERTQYASHKLGRCTGNAEDAELFAIDAALWRAQLEVEKGRPFRLVRIYSDARGVLEHLQHGSQYRFGPMLAQRTSLQNLYERAEWLTAKGVAVQLVWVKGHANSAGNHLADAAADLAIIDQVEFVKKYKPEGTLLHKQPVTEADVPQMWKELGQDWADEWLSRVNAHLFSEMKPGRRNAWSMELLRSSDADVPLEEYPPGDDHASLPDVFVDDRHAFVLPVHNLYGNVSIEQVIANLRDKCNAVDSQITDLEHDMAKNTKSHLLGHWRRDLAKLYESRAGMNHVLGTHVADCIAQGRAVSLISDEDGWVGDALLILLTL